jgi:hypothetical protein
MLLALTEPHFYLHHGGEHSEPHFISVWQYNLDEFYDDVWKEDQRFHLMNLVQLPLHLHDLLRNYAEGIKKKRLLSLNLIEEIDASEDGPAYCVHHTYKINIFKRIWRSKHTIREI